MPCPYPDKKESAGTASPYRPEDGRTGGLATAAATTAVVLRVGATTIVVVKQQAEDNDEEQPGAVTAAEQISQAHESISPFFSYY